MTAKGRLCAVALAAVMSSACYAMRGSSGGGEIRSFDPRRPNPADIALPPGYRVDVVSTGLTFPTGVAFDENGGVYVVESGYSYGEVWTIPRLLRIEAGGGHTPIVEGGRNGPWNGVAYAGGSFYIAEGGALEGGRILRVTDGKTTTLVSDLPSFGDHHTNGPAIGRDGAVYFGQGVATNSGVVGVDNAEFGWLARKPDFHDTPCESVTLTGRNFETDNPLTPGRGDKARTGAFSPFNRPTSPGQVIPGHVPCNGAIMKVAATGGKPELVAWGLRNPFGLAFDDSGQLYVTDNSYDERGSRPVWGSGDLLIAVKPGTWYGWPDYHGHHPLTMEMHEVPRGPQPEFLLQKHPGTPPKPLAVFGVHASADGLDVARNEAFGTRGQIYVALFGDMAPTAGKVLSPVGFKVVRVEPATGVIDDFATNRSDTNGPASRVGGGGLERPVAVRFTPDGSALYVVDFGILTVSKRGAQPHKGTGVLWRITRGGQS